MVFNFQSEYVEQLVYVVIVLLTVLLFVYASIRVARRIITDSARLYRAKRTIRAIAATVTILLLPVIFFSERGDLLTLMTVVGAGVAIALREVLLSIAGWLRILMMTPFKVGDRIEINGVHGDVVDIRILRTTMMETRGWVAADQSTGRIAHVPNSWIFEHALFNYNRGFRYIWHEMPVTITFRSDWAAARAIMEQFANEAAREVTDQAKQELALIQSDLRVHIGILTPYVYVKLVENGVCLTLRYLCDARKRRGTEHALILQILDAFKVHGGIEPAYPMLGLSSPNQTPFGPIPPPKPPPPTPPPPPPPA